MSETRHWKCAMCGEESDSEATDEECASEYEETFGHKLDVAAADVVCDDCWQPFAGGTVSGVKEKADGS